MFERREEVRFPIGQRPILLVVVDTEEEFVWGSFDRDATSVSAIREIVRFQEICDEFGIRPHYTIDYPIATQAEAFERLGEVLGEGRCEIGAHLHPWVNPPFSEEVSAFHSYPGNLEPGVERAKIIALTEAIEANLGVRPTAYKAGRYGLGPASTTTLEELGFEVDLSVYPRATPGGDGSPDYRKFSCMPFWFGRSRRLLELPVTAGFVGYLRLGGPAIASLADGAWGKRSRLGGVLSRLGALERVVLTPEGVDSERHRRLTRSVLSRGCPVLTFSFHSTSLAPGRTAYVADLRERERFLESCRSYFEFFMRDLGGTAMTPLELRDLLAKPE